MSKENTSENEVIRLVTAATLKLKDEYLTKAPIPLFASSNELEQDKPTGGSSGIDDIDYSSKIMTNADKAELLQEPEVLDATNHSTTTKVAVFEPPAITAGDTDYFNSRLFYCLPSAFYPYKDVLGVIVGYIVRWDVKIASGGTKKEVRPFTYDFVTKKWKSKFFGQGLPNSRPLYNLPEIIKRVDATIMIVEGEKTAAAAKHLFPEFVVTTSSGGACQANKSDWGYLKGRDIIFCPDADKGGEIYLTSVTKELRKIGVRINKLLEPSKLSPYVVQDGIITKREGAPKKGYDLADSLAEGWTAESIKQAQRNELFNPFFKELTKTGILREELKQDEELIESGNTTYKLSPAGLYRQYFVTSKAEDFDKYPDSGYSREELAIGVHKEKWEPLCGYLKPTHEIRDIDNSWGVLVEFNDINNITRETFLKRTDWLGEKGAVEVLQDQGLHLRGLKKEKFNCINEYLNDFKPQFKAVGVDMVGWQPDNSTYILPFIDDPRNNYTCTKEGEENLTYILQQKGVLTRSLKRKGTLSEWRRTVAAVTRGNHLHSFATLVALAAPALKLLDEEGGLFHYAGNTSIGKSTILHVAKSVWGFENLGSFRTTDNALESICKNGNDGALFFDEIGEVEPEALDKSIYMLGNGATKGRSDRSGNAKAVTNFTVLAQTTGEMGLVAKLAEKNKKAKGGQLIRMIELDADRGKGLNTFDVLNINPDTGKEFNSGRKQAEYLKLHAKENSGVVIDSFLTEVVKDIEGFIKGLKEAKAEWLKRKFKDKETGVEVSRVAKRFSTIYANGMMAVEFGIISHSPAEVEECISAMFDNWLERFGGDSSYELKTMIDDLYKLCIEQQHSRFCNAEPHIEDKVILPREKAGYWKMAVGTDGLIVLSEFWILPKVFEREVLKGKDKKAFYSLLVDKGYLKKGDDSHYTKLRRPTKESSQRFIVIDVDSLFCEFK